MWKSILFFFLLLYFLLSVSSKLLRFFRQLQGSAPPPKEGSIRIFAFKQPQKRKDFEGGDYVEFEEIK